MLTVELWHGCCFYSRDSPLLPLPVLVRLPCSSDSMTTKKKSSRVGKKSSFQPLKHVEVSLDGATVKMAIQLGGGDLSLGLRRAVVIASLRCSKGTAPGFGNALKIGHRR